MPLIQEPWDVYHAARDKHVTAHSLATYRRCPLEFIMERRGELKRPDSPAYAFGRALHTLVLEGEAALQQQYVVGAPINPKTQKPYGRDTKAYADWLAEQTLPVISTEELATMTAMREAVENHELACSLLSNGVAEGVLRAYWNGVACQSRLDWWDEDNRHIVDLKSCEDLDLFEHHARRFEYPEQVGGFYVGMAQQCGLGGAAGYMIAVEKRQPHRVGVWKISPASCCELIRRTEAALAAVADSFKNGVWPTKYEGLRQF